MGTFNQSSSPLSTLMPQSSPYKLPDYSNAFKMNNQMQMNNLKFRTGLLTSNSSDPTIALNGKNMMNDAMNPDYQDTQLLQNTNNSTTGGASFNWDQGFNVVSQIGNQIGDKAENIISSAGKLGSSIRMISQANKGIKAGLEGAKSAKMGGIGATIGAASDLVGSFMPQKTEYEGDKGDITQTMDSVYDGISDAAMAFGPVGMLVGGIMKGGSLLGKGLNALGGGTDGMCVCAGTKIFKASGEIINIEDLKKEDGIIGWDKNSKQIVPQLIHDFIEPRQKECLEIVLKNGYSIKCSIDHPILSDNSPKARNRVINGKRIAIRPWEFRRADELKVGDFVGLANNIDYWGNTNVPNAYIVGLLIGDGSYGKGASCRLISADPDTWRFLENNNLGVLNHCDDSRPEKYNKEIRTYRIIGGMELLHQLGIAYQTGKNKTLPKNIGKFDKVSVCNLLAGLFDTDGSISVNEEKQSYSITLYQSNINLLEEVRIQLHKLGIFSTIGTRKAAKYKFGGKIINSNESYRLEIHDISSVIKFYNLIPLNISYKKENLQRIYNMLKDKKIQEHNDISGAKQCKIVSITPIGVQTVYNLQADYNHTYLANCIITHNTTTDAILGSSFFNLTPLGLINGFGGTTSDTITKNERLFDSMGPSYSGTNQTVNDAVSKSGKKYGLFSSGALREANQEIMEAKRQQGILTNISNEASARYNIRNSMSAINGDRRHYKLQGSYNQSSVRVGRKGMSLEVLNKAKQILLKPKSTFTKIVLTSPELVESSITTITLSTPEFKDGGAISTKITLTNPELVESPKKTRTLEELIEYAKKENPRFIQRMSEPLKFVEWEDDKGKHFGTHELSYGESDGKIFIFPMIQEIDGNLVRYQDPTKALFNALDNKNVLQVNNEDEAKLFTESEELPDGTFTGYKSGWVDFFKQSPSKFQSGGSINVIPEGALHARKHNMDIDGITKKGIPVVSEGENGKVEQQAEIERSEVILRLEVTKKLEELQKDYYNDNYTQKQKDEFAIEAGKLLAYELLYNTIDNTNELL